jgi:hypothetical protein
MVRPSNAATAAVSGMSWSREGGVAEGRKVTLELTHEEAGLLLVALRDMKDDDGSSLWDHPKVVGFRYKLVNAIQDQIIGD